MFFLSCVCYAFVRLCLYVPCGHLLGKGWSLGSRLWCPTVSLFISHWYLGSGVVFDCIDSWTLHPYLLWPASLKVLAIKGKLFTYLQIFTCPATWVISEYLYLVAPMKNFFIETYLQITLDTLGLMRSYGMSSSNKHDTVWQIKIQSNLVNLMSFVLEVLFRSIENSNKEVDIKIHSPQNWLLSIFSYQT